MPAIEIVRRKVNCVSGASWFGTPHLGVSWTKGWFRVDVLGHGFWWAWSLNPRKFEAARW
jgi:hypothetical protein